MGNGPERVPDIQGKLWREWHEPSFMGQPEQPKVSRWRQLIHVVGVDEDEQGNRTARAIVPGWDPDVEVTFSEDIVPEELRGSLVADEYFIGEVNLAAEDPSQVNPTISEIAPPPVPESELWDKP